MLRESDLKAALSGGHIVPYFQPLVCLNTRQIEGFEVLARWMHPELGVVKPDQFVPLAEETGLIHDVTEALLETAFTAAAVLPAEIGLAVNISPLQLHDRGLVAMVRGASERHNFALNRLTVEITESAIVTDLDRTRKLFGELHELEVRISLDDFGTGYSSLQHLDTLPFDELKVDRRFVEAMSTGRSTRKIAAAIVGMGQSLGLETVAEGIDNAEQAERLLWLGCDRGQGWYFGKAVEAKKLAAALARGVAWDDARVETHISVGDFYPVDTSPLLRFAQLKAIFDSAPVGLCYLDKRMRYLNINRRLSEIFGVPVPEHLGRSMKEVLPGLFSLIEPNLRRAVQGVSQAEVELTIPRPGHPDGDATLLMYYQPARDESGEVMGVSVVAVDISDRKRMEETLRVTKETLRQVL